jgi:hypothetical protein
LHPCLVDSSGICMKKPHKPVEVARTHPVREPVDFLGVFTVESWREFLRNGGQVMGFNAKKAGIASRLLPGDRILCYLSKVSAFAGWMEVTGPSYVDTKPLWSDGLYPIRLPVRVVEELALSNSVPIKSLRQELSFMRGRGEGGGWSIYVRSSPRRWSALDAAIVRSAISSHTKRAVEVANRNSTSPEIEALISGKSVKLNFKTDSRVMRVIRKTQALLAEDSTKFIGSYDKVLSFNKVTGYSVNVPIASTCRPTATCLETCYFAKGASSWTNSLKHQAAVQNSIAHDPKGFAERVALEYDQLGLTFLRWNGGGDLFVESVSVINYLGRIRPDMILWVVTRIPELAAQIDHLENVFIHFSLDRHSLNRREKFIQLKPRSANYFFSYQCEPGELPPHDRLGHAAVLFFDNYEPTGNLDGYKKEIVCPLNGKVNIAETCVKCRRCFNGEAVNYEITKPLT